MSRTSEYTLDLVVKGDDVRNTIRALENELKGLGDKAKKATDTSGITDSLKNAQTAIGGMKSQMADMAKAMGGDFDSILKAYERNSAKAISQFEAQYAKLEAERKSKEGEYKRLQEELKSANHSADLLARTPGKNPTHSYTLIAQIQERIKDLGYDQLKTQIEQNRHVRANLADIRRQAMLEQEEVKQANAAKEAEAERTKERRKLQELEEAYEKAKEKRTTQKHDSGTELKTLKDQLSEAKKADNTAEIKRLEQAIKDAKARKATQSEDSDNELSDLKEKIRLQRASVELEEAQNRLADEQVNAKRKEKYDKLEELKAKRKAARGLAEKALLKQEIALQKAYIKQVEAAEKAQKRNGQAIQSAISKTEKMAKAWEITRKAIAFSFKGVAKLAANTLKFGAGATQFAYNVTGMVGGAARTAIGAGKAAFGMVSGAISSVSGAADKQVDREKQAARIKGSLSDDEKQKLLQQVYIKTGADYGVIVDAINAIQNTFGQKVKPDELAQAAAMEIQYPGTASTFLSSTEGESNMDKFKMYANRLKAIQGATGASTEQIQASTKFVSQYANHDTGASVSQLQAVYLAMQNQGVFNSEEELQTAFKRFVSQQAKSGMSPVEFAKQFDWSAYAKGADGQTRATNALTTMNWEALNKAATTTDTEIPKDSSAKSMAEKMRELEEKKNEMMMKLIPVIMPVVEELSKLLNSSEGQAIIDGLVGIFKTVLPLLEPIFKVLKVVLDFANEYLLRPLEKAIRAIMDWLGVDEENEKPELANGGIASMPSICGERGPEAIIPLDFSRAARATNIATNISQTFHMTGNQTTALSLAQAVRSRDFSRAMTDNLFITNRCGGF